jgi:hypothetical protein
MSFRPSLVAIIGSTAIILACGSAGSDDKHSGGSSLAGGSRAPASAGRSGSSVEMGGSGNAPAGGQAGLAGGSSGNAPAGGRAGSTGGSTSSGVGGTSEEGGSAGTGGAAPRYSVNDVTCLFPLPANAAEFSKLLGMATTGSHGPLLSSDSYTTLIAPNIPIAVYKDLRVVALRLDPCASQTTVKDPGSCQCEIRLVAQPIRALGGPSSFEANDAGVHLIYRVARTELDAALGELVALRDAAGVRTAGIALGPHPAIVKEGLSGAFAQGVNAVIQKYVGTSNLFRVTDFGIDAVGLLGTTWNFFQFDKNGSGAFAPSNIPTQPGSAGQEQVTEGGGNFDTARDTGVGDLDPSGYPQAFLKSGGVSGLDSNAITGALNRLAALENPALYSNAAIDCVSCHLPSTALPFFEQLTHAQPTESYKAPPGQNTAHKDGAGVSANMLHALGYNGTRLQVSQRVVNESARVADWLSNGF